MLRPALPCVLAALALAAAPAARAADPPAVVGSVAAGDAQSVPYAVVAYADAGGRILANRVRPDGTLGSPLAAASGQHDVRDVQAVMTDRGEIVVVWAAYSGGSNGRSTVRYAVAPPGRSFSGTHTLATVGSNTSATPRLAALRGGTTAVIFRDTAGGLLRYARRAPYGSFGTARSLGHDGVGPEIQPSPGGGALVAWGRGPLTARALEVASAQRGAPLPGKATSVAGHIRSLTLAASSDGTAWVTWTRRDSTGTTGFARRTREANAGAVGPVQSLGNVAYGVPHIAIAPRQRILATWNALGPGAAFGNSDVGLRAALGNGASLPTPKTFDAGGFSQTSPIPAFQADSPLVLLTRQIPTTTGAPSEVAAADPTTGQTTTLGPAASIAPPAVAHNGDTLIVAWAAATGGVAVSARR